MIHTTVRLAQEKTRAGREAGQCKGAAPRQHRVSKAARQSTGDWPLTNARRRAAALGGILAAPVMVAFVWKRRETGGARARRELRWDDARCMTLCRCLTRIPSHTLPIRCCFAVCAPVSAANCRLTAFPQPPHYAAQPPPIVSCYKCAPGPDLAAKIDSTFCPGTCSAGSARAC